jgi:hypothetical protein
VSREDIRAGEARYDVLSYQAHCKLYDPAQPDAPEWGGVCFPVDGRLTLPEFLLFALHQGIKSGAVERLPTDIFLVGHFTRADARAFADFAQLTMLMSAVRNTFVSVDQSIPVQYEFDDGRAPVELRVRLRDTGLLAATASKSLAALGDVVGVPKVVLDPDPRREEHLKKNMDVLLREQPALFERYAYTDAVICVRYLDQILDVCEAVLGERKRPPLTLSGIGVNLLLKTWEDDGLDGDAILGCETVRVREYDKKRGRYVSRQERVPFAEFHLHEALAVEAYHGGRGEQYWFGPGAEDEWTDYDLAGAYPTAMSLIPRPDWRGAFVTRSLEDFTDAALGVAWLTFKFPPTVRFPTIPVRTANGLIFPLEGESSCAAPEVALAVRLGAEIKIKHGVVIPPLDGPPIFESFIAKCVARRKEHPKGSLRELFWKETTNSTYGKLAQGLREKRVYDLRERATKPLPASKITNPYFAAYTTSFVRAVLGEILNRLPAETTVFSCTTDGFLSNATPEQMAAAASGPLCTLYAERRGRLTGDARALEIKHRIKKPLGWRTRAQATLHPGDGPEADDSTVVLAKGGIWTPAHLETVRERNDYIIDLFFDRRPDSVIEMTTLTGVRDMVEHDADLVEKMATKRLTMEFDWKRRPLHVGADPGTGHVCFSTQPWLNRAQFETVRAHWDDFWTTAPEPMKSVEHYRAFANYLLIKTGLSKADARYLKSTDPDLKRLRQCLGAAWRHSEAGLQYQERGISNAQFAGILTDAGISCSRADIENDGRRKGGFQPQRCPRTPAVLQALGRLSVVFPSLDWTRIVADGPAAIDLLSALPISSSSDVLEAA